MQDATEVAQGLEEIAALLRLSGAAKFKIKAYEQEARVVTTLGGELGPLVEQDRLRSLQGIGSALSRQISELWNTGASDLLLELRREHPEGAAELVETQGLTPRRIRALHAALAGALRRGAETVDVLELVAVGDVAAALRHLTGLRQVLRVDLDERVAYLSDGVRLSLQTSSVTASPWRVAAG